MPRSSRSDWVVGVLIFGVALALVAAIAAREMRSGPAGELAPGETETLRARVVQVLDEAVVLQGDFEQPYQRLLLRISNGSPAGQEVEVEHGRLGLTSEASLFQVGDRVLVEHNRTPEGDHTFAVIDWIRTSPLLWLALLFVAATLLLSGRQGARSLAGMGVTLAVLFGFIVPQILAGRSPVGMALLGSVAMIGISLYLVYGWQRKTHAAVAGLFLSLIITGLLAAWFVSWARLTGFGSEEAGFLQVAGTQVNLQGVLLAGILVGTLGALDDVAINQSSAVFELSNANPALGRGALFRHGMVIGRDHIAAMVNTLLLAYAGVALPMLLLLSIYTEPLGTTLNREIIAEEVVRTLVGSLGLLAGVPLTTLIAAFLVRPPRPGEGL